MHFIAKILLLSFNKFAAAHVEQFKITSVPLFARKVKSNSCKD